MTKKLFILVPDGVGLRNFAYGHFVDAAESAGFDVTFWNQTPFDLENLGYKEIKMKDVKIHPMTFILKNVRLRVDLKRNIKKSNDRIYNSYRFKSSYQDLKQSVRSIVTEALTKINTSEKGMSRVRKNIKRREKSTPFYQSCLETLKKEKPDLVFCTNHRMATCIAPILAAQELGIPTATFIFSWDNLPKATMALETDYYFVWSEHMKRELLHYHEYVREDQIFVTGTPQFEPHQDKSLIESREAFFAAHGLDPAKKYICYSGDDVTTSPDDPQLLADTAQAIARLNAKGHQYGLIFRRCPVDFSGRHNAVLENYRDIIVSIDPAWEKIGGSWNAVLPTKADIALQMNTIAHTELVLNVGSSMVFDYVSFGKPCVYVNYDVVPSARPDWTIKRIYSLVHFRSMPSKSAVIWIENPEEIESKIEDVLSGKVNPVPDAQRWFEIIVKQPADSASKRMVEAFGQIVGNRKK